MTDPKSRTDLVAVLKQGFSDQCWWSRALVAFLYVPASALYQLTNRLAADRGVYTILKWPVDDLIPFVPAFIVPYYIWYLLMLGVLAWLVADRIAGRHIVRYTMAIVFSMVLASLIFVMFPTHVPRPEVRPDGLLNRMVLLIYQIDRPYNCFPSLHVSGAALAALMLHQAGPRLLWFRLANIMLLILIALSTVFTGQHYVPDIPGGLVLAGVSWLLAGGLIRQTRQARSLPD